MYFVEIAEKWNMYDATFRIKREKLNFRNEYVHCDVLYMITLSCKYKTNLFVT